MTLKEVAKYLKVKPATIYRLCKEGKLPASKISIFWRFKKSVIDKYIKDGGMR